MATAPSPAAGPGSPLTSRSTSPGSTSWWLVEDIVDTGNTVSCLIAHLQKKGALSISVCTFLDKPARRTVDFQLVGGGKFYRGFECPDSFVVGYGMDYAELYRNLPYVGVLKPEMYSKKTDN
ncbi:hypothetical protein CFC21_001298 [Triticum aestivum]|uniref:Hypoxanthine phosphoribosyltransferase n=1 Tax=Triticum aestivum TaxID=4565 RepID=A0A3B5XWN7_WHEAT|nr:hypothetical protein CFC21_001298 [Triticum aestivum]